jgi:hypothetical protein
MSHLQYAVAQHKAAVARAMRDNGDRWPVQHDDLAQGAALSFQWLVQDGDALTWKDDDAKRFVTGA